MVKTLPTVHFSSRGAIRLVAGCLMAMICLVSLLWEAKAQGSRSLIYFGTPAGPESKGVYARRFAYLINIAYSVE
jgi:hypothetical protein